MNIYKVSRISDVGYDQYYSFICYAITEEDAKNINPAYVCIDDDKFLNDKNYHLPFFINWNENCDKRGYIRDYWVENKNDLIVKKIGESNTKQI